MHKIFLLSLTTFALALGVVSASAQDKKDAKPAAEVAVLKFKDFGDIVVEFFPDVAPKTVENFKKLVFLPKSARAQATTVVAWGANYSGQTTVPAGLSGVTAITARDSHTVALKTDGTVVAWGDNYYGQTTVPAGLSGVTALPRDEKLMRPGNPASWTNAARMSRPLMLTETPSHSTQRPISTSKRAPNL